MCVDDAVPLPKEAALGSHVWLLVHHHWDLFQSTVSSTLRWEYKNSVDDLHPVSKSGASRRMWELGRPCMTLSQLSSLWSFNISRTFPPRDDVRRISNHRGCLLCDTASPPLSSCRCLASTAFCGKELNCLAWFWTYHLLLSFLASLFLHWAGCCCLHRLLVCPSSVTSHPDWEGSLLQLCVWLQSCARFLVVVTLVEEADLVSFAICSFQSQCESELQWLLLMACRRMSNVGRKNCSFWDFSTSTWLMMF